MSGEAYYVRARGKVTGPFNVDELRSMRSRGQLGRFHELSTDQFTWAPASSLEHLFPAALKPSSSGILPAMAEAPAGGSDRDGNWFYADATDEPVGPTQWSSIQELHQRKQLDRDTYVWREGTDRWTTLGKILDPSGRSDAQDVAAPPPGPAWADIRLALWLFFGAACVQFGAALIVAFGLIGAGSLLAIPALALLHAENHFVVAGFLRLIAQITACVACWYCRLVPGFGKVRLLAMTMLYACVAETVLAATGMIVLAAGQGESSNGFIVLMLLAFGAGTARAVFVHLFLRQCTLALKAPKNARILLILLFYCIGGSVLLLFAFVFAAMATSEGVLNFMLVLTLIAGVAWAGWLVWYGVVLLQLRKLMMR